MTDARETTNRKSISFAGIVQGRDASVRITDDDLLYAVDLVIVMTGKERDYSGRILRDISDEVFDSSKFIDRQISSRGGPKTKLVSFHDAIALVMVLPGKVVKEIRTKFADILHRYIAGDRTLIDEINANASSASPIVELARGVKRGHGELDFVLQAFDYQKKALDLRHETMTADDTEAMLDRKIKEEVECIEKLEVSLEILRNKQEEDDIELHYARRAVWNLSKYRI